MPVLTSKTLFWSLGNDIILLRMWHLYHKTWVASIFFYVEMVRCCVRIILYNYQSLIFLNIFLNTAHTRGLHHNSCWRISYQECFPLLKWPVVTADASCQAGQQDACWYSPLLLPSGTFQPTTSSDIKIQKFSDI